MREGVIKGIDDVDPQVRGEAIQAVRPLIAKQPALREAVAQRLNDQSEGVRGAAIQAMAPFISDPEVRKRVTPGLRMDDEIMRIWRFDFGDLPPAALVKCWGQWLTEEPSGRHDIVKMLDSEDSRLRQSGAEILAAAGKDAVSLAVPQLLLAMDDHRGLDSWPARIAAAEM